jgi:hypothetical protein
MELLLGIVVLELLLLEVLMGLGLHVFHELDLCAGDTYSSDVAVGVWVRVCVICHCGTWCKHGQICKNFLRMDWNGWFLRRKIGKKERGQVRFTSEVRWCMVSPSSQSPTQTSTVVRRGETTGGSRLNHQNTKKKLFRLSHGSFFILFSFFFLCTNVQRDMATNVQGDMVTTHAQMRSNVGEVQLVVVMKRW